MKPKATYQDVLDAPEHLIAELIDGELFLSPRPGGPHTSVASLVGGELIPRFWHGDGGPGGWIILFEPELHLGSRVIVPDLAGWRTTRMPAVPDAPHFTLAPDWVCEIASRSTERLDRRLKMPAYAEAGVGHFWWIQPRMRMLEVMRLVDGRWTVLGSYGDDERRRLEPFEAVELDLSRLWRGVPLVASESSELYYSP